MSEAGARAPGLRARADVTLTISDTHHGERLDRALCALWPAERAGVASRAMLQRWIREGRVTLDGVEARDPSVPVRRGQRAEVRPAPPTPSEAIAEDLALAILHEDDDVVVIDKAAGMVVHPAAGHASGTLVNALLFRYGALPTASRRPPPTAAGETGEAEDAEDDEDEPDRRRPGIVHRLDRWTSGVMVVARSDRAQRSLVAQLAAHSVDRAYLAFVEGTPPPWSRHDTLHGRHPTDRKRFTTRVSRGKRAVTNVELLERFDGASLVRCTLETGRTHQIRVHLAEAGFPLLGDPVYGRPARSPRVRRATEALAQGRHALHAALLGFDHPATSRRVRFESPLPDDLVALDARLRAG